MSIDILIIGAGPAGCMAAIGALKTNPNLNVVLIDKEMGPRHRIGEIMLTQTVIEFNKYGIADDMAKHMADYGWARKFGLGFVMGKDRKPWRILADEFLAADTQENNYPKSFTTEEGRIFTCVVPRHEFDQAMRQVAQSRGAHLLAADVEEVRVAGLDQDSMIVGVRVKHLDGREETLRPKVVIDCTGQAAFMSRRVGERLAPRAAKLSARYAYFRNIDYENAAKYGFFTEGANIMSYGDGWVWLAPLGKSGLSTIGVVTAQWDQDFLTKLRGLPEAPLFGLDREHQLYDHEGNPMDQARFYAHPDYTRISTVRYGKNWSSAGDAACFLDPLLSQGVTLAVTFGGRIGTVAAESFAHTGTSLKDGFAKVHRHYQKEADILGNLIKVWYRSADEQVPQEWLACAQRIAKIHGREIKDDITAFRWIANLENVHVIINGGLEEDILDRLIEATGSDNFF
jgi:flavin-dependent dehydrogenase